MRKIVMDEIKDLTELNGTDYLLIIFKKQNLKGLTFKFVKEDFYVNIFDDVVYLFDRGLDIKGRFPLDVVDKFVRVQKYE